MVGTSKILTVSYGTFSCTLEGFDDSFNTMKAIAEYFRDLAAEDRYFGAEPPSPDADLLAKIAEQEISRRVDGRMEDDSSIVLRAAALANPTTQDIETEAFDDAEAKADEDAQDDAEATDAEVDEDAEGDVEATEAEVDEDAEGDVEATETEVDEDAADNSNVSEFPTQPDADSAAAKLQRIRAIADESDTGASELEDMSEQFLPESDTMIVSDDVEISDDTDDLLADDDAEENVTSEDGEDLEDNDVAEDAVDTIDDGLSSDLNDSVADDIEDQIDHIEFAAEDAQIETPADDSPNSKGALDAIQHLMGEQDTDAEDDNAVEDKDNDVSEQPGFMAEAENVEDEALDRLMSETDSQMNEPEGNRRRNAIAQLKAAVAAKEAARQIGEADDDGQKAESAFRNDLTAVSQSDTPPAESLTSAPRTERPRPAPLKLVAEQRVDHDEDVKDNEPDVVANVPEPAAAPTRPVDVSGAINASSFEEFVDKMDAKQLPDLLEAAAAYTSFVEGAEEFSRPQILRRARSIANNDFKREDGLRSFADLLSEGRFTEVRNGRFQVADDSRFNPERQAG